jgi:hypothetical protein
MSTESISETAKEQVRPIDSTRTSDEGVERDRAVGTRCHSRVFEVGRGVKIRYAVFARKHVERLKWSNLWRSFLSQLITQRGDDRG